MTRLTVIFSLLSSAIGIVLFQLKYEVASLEQTERRLKRSCHETQEAINVLKAEWEHLNEPKRLQLLTARYLDLTPVKASQIVSLRDLAGNSANYDSALLDQLIQEVDEDSRKQEAG